MLFPPPPLFFFYLIISFCFLFLRLISGEDTVSALYLQFQYGQQITVYYLQDEYKQFFFSTLELDQRTNTTQLVYILRV